MKISVIFFTTAILYLVASCKNTSDNINVNIDSASTVTNNTPTPADPVQDTAMMGHSMSKSMDASMQKMHALTYTGDFDIDFANMMIVHHQGALDMALVEVEKGSDEKMKAMASAIIAKQEIEQQELRDFVKNYKPSGMKHGEGALEKSMNEMMSRSGKKTMSGNVDKDFATMMASHHSQGVAMAKMELKHGMDKSLKKMAQKMITDQQREISEFEQWISAMK